MHAQRANQTISTPFVLAAALTMMVMTSSCAARDRKPILFFLPPEVGLVRWSSLVSIMLSRVAWSPCLGCRIGVTQAGVSMMMEYLMLRRGMACAMRTLFSFPLGDDESC